MNKAKSQPMTDQPNTHEPKRTRIASVLSRPLKAAKYAGVNIIHIKTPTITIRFAIHKMPVKDII